MSRWPGRLELAKVPHLVLLTPAICKDCNTVTNHPESICFPASMEDVGWVLRYYLHLFALHSYQNSFKSQVTGPDYFGLLFTLISLYLAIHKYLPHFPSFGIHSIEDKICVIRLIDCERSHLVEDEQPDLLLTSPAMNQWWTIWNGQWTAMRLQRRQAEARAMKTKLYQTSHHLNHPLGLKMMKAGHENHEYEGNWRNDRVP